jgi:hypothetical protein
MKGVRDLLQSALAARVHDARNDARAVAALDLRQPVGRQARHCPGRCASNFDA